MSAYYPQIQCVLIDADGVRTNAALESFDVYNVTTATNEGSLGSDANGIIDSGTLGVSDGDILELTHATYPGVYRCVAKTTQIDAYTKQGNYGCTYVVEDLQTPAPSTQAILIAVDKDNPDAAPIRLGNGLSGETAKFGIQRGLVARNFRIYPVSQRKDGGIVKADYDLFTSEYSDVTIPAITIGGLAGNQSANTVFAGPTSGGAAAPTFRALVAADIPNLDASKITAGTIATARLGSGTANSTTFLRGDQTWQTISTGITIGSTAISSGTNGRILYQSGGVVQQSSGLTFDGTNFDMAAGGNVIMTAGYLMQRTNGRNRFHNSANSNWAEMWCPSTDGSAKINIFDGTGTGIHLDGSGNIGIGTTSPSVKFHINGSAQIDGSLTLSAQNIVTDTTTGMKIGTSTSQKIGFFNKTPVTQRTNIAQLTDSTGGSIVDELFDVTGSDTVRVSIVNDNFASCADRLNKIEQILEDLGLAA